MTNSVTVPTAKISSKGQVAIPEQIREYLSPNAGSQLVVAGSKNAAILKRIAVPALMSGLDHLIRQARAQARPAGPEKIRH